MLAKVIPLLSFTLVLTSFHSASASRTPLPDRLQHAKELLGPSYKQKVNPSGASSEDVTDFVFETTKAFLPKKHKKHSEKIATSILNAAEEYALDPVFVMAVIQNESSFKPDQIGPVGEIGLMQLKPDTAKWIADLYGLEFNGRKSLKKPEINITLGCALIHKLRTQFEASSYHYVTAYNVGPSKLRQLLSKDVSPKDYVHAVMRRYLAFYSGFRKSKDPKVQSKLAYQKTLELTRSME